MANNGVHPTHEKVRYQCTGAAQAPCRHAHTPHKARPTRHGNKQSIQLAYGVANLFDIMLGTEGQRPSPRRVPRTLNYLIGPCVCAEASSAHELYGTIRAAQN